MTLLAGLRVAQLGPGTAAAVCGRLLADIGASVWCDAAEHATRLDTYLDQGKAAAGEDTLAAADLIICEGSPKALSGRGHDVSSLRARAPMASVVLISPFGQTGPQAEDPATDLTLFAASGISRLLTGQVDDLTEPPIRPVGTQSAFIGGLAAACAGMHACLTDGASVIDVSIQEALATLAMTELARAGQTGTSWRRRREADGNGATVCILPAHDGYAAISPREERQWRAWLLAMGSPAWGNDARFARKPDRIANWDALHALMMAWSRDLTKQQIADLAQAAHVPSFPLRDPTEMLGSTQLAHRAFWKTLEIEGRFVQAPGSPFGLQLRATEDAAAPVDPAPLPPAKRRMPLAGVRVRLQLGDRGANSNSLSRSDGRRGDQGRGSRHWRSRPRVWLA
jgi:crotonobetainyl-CoA:carnitine CoA-transferase CaiB-like acyl-CoA transferase